MKGTASEVATAATLIIFDSNTVHGPCGLFVRNKQLYTKPLRDRKRNDRLVRRFTKQNQEDGFSWSEWRRLKAQIVRLLKEGQL
ncbi:unnamed protein product [marine sediment metagenome]|uniref:Uncharacterized protein n=1 Tax=marine sediment metagenome TaxID=412755 RepID=X1GYI0_9ZZZZ